MVGVGSIWTTWRDRRPQKYPRYPILVRLRYRSGARFPRFSGLSSNTPAAAADVVAAAAAVAAAHPAAARTGPARRTGRHLPGLARCCNPVAHVSTLSLYFPFPLSLPSSP